MQGNGNCGRRTPSPYAVLLDDEDIIDLPKVDMRDLVAAIPDQVAGQSKALDRTEILRALSVRVAQVRVLGGADARLGDEVSVETPLGADRGSQLLLRLSQCLLVVGRVDVIVRRRGFSRAQRDVSLTTCGT
jgi:hypothetical protein